MIKNTRKETLEKLVVKVFNEEIDNIVKELCLSITPTYDFNSDSDDRSASAYVTSTYSYVNVNWHSIKITDTKTDGVIHFNLPSLVRECDMYRTLCRCNVDREVILFTLRHECRHIWQNTTGWFNGRIQNNSYGSIDFLDAHGSQTEEKDADAFALKTVNNKVRMVGELLVEVSNITPIMAMTGDMGRIKELAPTICKTYSPVRYYMFHTLETVAYKIRSIIKANKASK